MTDVDRGGPGTVTRLLSDWARGDEAAADRLFPLVYEELRALARRQRRRRPGGDTLDTTALVHEVYLKLTGRDAPALRGREHFYALASRAMRHVLSNHARRARTRKRGDGATPVRLDDVAETLRDARGVLAAEHLALLEALDTALAGLERVSERQARVVECRFYGGLSIPETATALGVSEATVKRDWVVAQAWLHRALAAHVRDGA